MANDDLVEKGSEGLHGVENVLSSIACFEVGESVRVPMLLLADGLRLSTAVRCAVGVGASSGTGAMVDELSMLSFRSIAFLSFLFLAKSLPLLSLRIFLNHHLGFISLGFFLLLILYTYLCVVLLFSLFVFCIIDK